MQIRKRRKKTTTRKRRKRRKVAREDKVSLLTLEVKVKVTAEVDKEGKAATRVVVTSKVMVVNRDSLDSLGRA